MPWQGMGNAWRRVLISSAAGLPLSDAIGGVRD